MHPDYAESIAEIAMLRDGLSDKLRSRGMSSRRIASLRKKPEQILGKYFDHHAVRALHFCDGFMRQIGRDVPRAVYLAIQAARSAQRALDYENAVIEQGWTRHQKSQNAMLRSAKIRSVVENKIRDKRGLASAKSVHAWCRIEEEFGMKLGRFKNWWTAQKMSEFRKRTRKDFHV
jgi:hypothetical protein